MGQDNFSAVNRAMEFAGVCCCCLAERWYQLRNTTAKEGECSCKRGVGCCSFGGVDTTIPLNHSGGEWGDSLEQASLLESLGGNSPSTTATTTSIQWRRKHEQCVAKKRVYDDDDQLLKKWNSKEGNSLALRWVPLTERELLPQFPHHHQQQQHLARSASLTLFSPSVCVFLHRFLRIVCFIVFLSQGYPLLMCVAFCRFWREGALKAGRKSRKGQCCYVM